MIFLSGILFLTASTIAITEQSSPIPDIESKCDGDVDCIVDSFKQSFFSLVPKDFLLMLQRLFCMADQIADQTLRSFLPGFLSDFLPSDFFLSPVSKNVLLLLEVALGMVPIDRAIISHSFSLITRALGISWKTRWLICRNFESPEETLR